MTIQMQHLSIIPDDSVWLDVPGARDVTSDETFANDLLSVVRHIMREESCTIIPIIRAAVIHPVNEYGHNMQVEVTYARTGWRAIYAATVAERVTRVQCYMS